MSELIKKAAELTRLEHEGERVITLAQMDEMHERPPGTAGRTFRKHRGELLAGEEYFEIGQPDVLRRVGFERVDGSVPVKAILLTERGYLLLVKWFRDKRAVEVQRTLIKHYFKTKEQPPQQFPPFDMELFASIMEKRTERTVRDELKPIGFQVGNVANKVEENTQAINKLDEKLDALNQGVKRKPLAKAVKRQHVDTIRHFYNGMCPCCGIVEVVDEYHVKLPSGNWEHWYASNQSKLHQTWLTCAGCNQKLENDREYKQKMASTFTVYQLRSEQKYLPLFKEFND